MSQRYTTLWRNKFLTLDAKNLDDLVNGLEEAVTAVKEMRATGKITMDPEGAGDDYIWLYTEDSAVAEKFGFSLDEEDEDEDDEDEGEDEAE